jgi:uncharacterized ion transporter superfamily protein YfcC
MSNKKRKQPEVIHEINQVSREVKHVKHEEEQRDKGESVIRWIFFGLIALAIVYFVWGVLLNS